MRNIFMKLKVYYIYATDQISQQDQKRNKIVIASKTLLVLLYSI